MGDRIVRTHAMAFFVAKGLIDVGVDDAMMLAPPSFQGMRRMLDAVHRRLQTAADDDSLSIPGSAP